MRLRVLTFNILKKRNTTSSESLILLITAVSAVKKLYLKHFSNLS
jgi:hypothetical protein